MRLAASLLPCAVLIGLRMPQVVISGRFWAEEGQVFFRNAWIMPPGQALLVSFGGYLNLIANAATLAARWLMPLKLAPYLTIAVALLVQLCPPLLMLSARDAWLRPPWIRLAGVLLILLVPDAEEVWLQTLHCQFELALSCGIVLALDEAGGLGRIFRRGLLVLAPLCGPVAAALLPLFILRAILDRSRERLVQATILGASAAVQFLFFVHLVSGREYSIDPVALLCVIAIRHIELPFLGVAGADLGMRALRAARASGQVPWRTLALPILVLLPLAFAALRHRRTGPAFWFLAASACVAALSYAGAIGGLEGLLGDVRAGERYTLVPQALLSLSVFTLALTAGGWTARMCRVAVILLLAIGAREYTRPWPFVSHGPPWREQVAAWRADPRRSLQIWPVGWSMSLGGRTE